MICGQCGQFVFRLSNLSTTGRKAGNKETGSGGFVDNVDNLDSPIKSLAYNIVAGVLIQICGFY